jgi:predicted ABC-type ATPase
MKPSIYIIAGPNGAGKTTFANEYLPDFVHCDEFLNADLIAAGLSPFAPHTQAFRASGLLLERIQELVAQKQTFAFETTLAGRSYSQMIPEFQQAGYCVHLFFLFLPNADMAVERVRNRVQQGGHDIPEPDIRRRYERGLKNCLHLYRPLVDGWFLYDSSQLPPRLIAQEYQQQTHVVDAVLFREIELSTENAT